MKFNFTISFASLAPTTLEIMHFHSLTSAASDRAGYLIRSSILLLFAIFVFAMPIAHAGTPASSLQEFADASLEDLLAMTVTTVSRVPEELRKAPAAVYVITSEDIRRSGVTSVPEALRLAPGVNVAKVNANRWAVSIRGFNARAADKLLVLLDGRSIYNPLFSGTLWETRDVMLENVERIEIIRGPGGSAWGANAMNGVINIITKSAKDTQGTFVSGGGGSEERAFGMARYGAKISEKTHYRANAKYINRDGGYAPGFDLEDDSYSATAGFRTDTEVDHDTSYSFQGRGYTGEHGGLSAFDDVIGTGGSVQGQWDDQLSERSHLTVLGYYDVFTHDYSIIGEKRNTAEMTMQHAYQASDNFVVVSGLQYRFTSDRIQNTDILAIDPTMRNDNLVSGGVQGRVRLIPDTLDGRLGVKVEHNDYSNVEVQPDAALSWTVTPKDTLWVSVSRAVSTPSRLENDFLITNPETSEVLFTGNRELDAESLVAYETGYRTIVREDLLFDVTCFFNSYTDISVARGTTIVNGAEGETYGAEVAVSYTPVKWWQLKTSYSYLNMELELDDSDVEDSLRQIESLEGNSPSNQLTLWQRFDISGGWEFDIGIRYVDHLTLPHVRSYTVADIRLGYRVSEQLMLDVIGQNLFDRHHFEQGTVTSSQVQEGVFARATWTF